MATQGKVYVGDEGTIIDVDTFADLSSATTTIIKVFKPSGAIVEWPGSVVDGTKIRYVTSQGDLDEVGTYTIVAYVELPDWKGHGEPDELKVWAVGT